MLLGVAVYEHADYYLCESCHFEPDYAGERATEGILMEPRRRVPGLATRPRVGSRARDRSLSAPDTAAHHEAGRYSQATAVRSLAALFAAGGIVGLVSLAVPHGPGIDLTLSIVTAAAGLPVAGVLMVLGPRWPSWIVPLLLPVGTLAVSIGVFAGGRSPVAAAAAVLYVWVGLFGALFLSARGALAQLGWAGLSFGVVLGIHHSPGSPAQWVLVIGTTAVVVAVVGPLARKLGRQATTDPLTKTANRSTLLAVLTREVDRSRRHGAPLTVAMVDLDNFKEVNDRQGHVAGDRVLAETARQWSAALRSVDLLARYGGDEFAVVLPDTDAAHAAQVLDRMVGASEVPCSIGWAQWKPTSSAHGLLAEADAALYEAKQHARTQRAGGVPTSSEQQACSCASPLPPPTAPLDRHLRLYGRAADL